MRFLRWLGGSIVLFWLIAVLLRIGGNLINLLLIVATIVFMLDTVSIRRKNM